MASDQDRRVLYEVLERELGHGPATTMMELLPPAGWADLARQSDLVAVRGEMAQLRGGLTGEMADLRTDLKGQMADLRTELQGEMADLRSDMTHLRTDVKGEMADLRGDLAHLRTDMADLRIEVKAEVAELRAEVRAQLPRLYMANIGMAFATAGLVLASAKLA